MGDLYDKAEAMQYYMDEALRRFKHDGTPEEIAENCQEIVDEHRILGLYAKLLADDDGAFCAHLTRSARDWLYYLLRVFGGLPARRRDYCLSKKNAFLAAVAAGDMRAATLISLFTPKQFEKDWEDLDDFLYALFLHQMVLRSHEDESFIAKVLKDYAHEASSLKTARPAICSALYARDGGAFDAAMEDLVSQREKEIEIENVARNKLPMEFAVTSEIFLEGLALIRIAKSLGMNVIEEYRFIPQLPREVSEPWSAVHDQLHLTVKEKSEVTERFAANQYFTPYRADFDAYLALDV